jgi:hypothetical protein
MPLFSITTSLDYVSQKSLPVETGPGVELRPEVAFGLTLPLYCCRNAEALRLESQTVPDAVQVTFKSFGPDDINIPDIWIEGRFTEGLPEREQLAVRDIFWGSVMEWFSQIDGESPRIAMDLFWGSGHGCLAFGETRLSW